MSVLTVASSKGGVGKTMVASSLATVLAELDGPVLAVDSDSNTSLTIAFGHEVDAGADLGAAILDALPDGNVPELEARIVPSGCEGVDLLPANTASMVRADRLMTSEPGSDRVLRSALAVLRERYRWIVIDTPAALNNLTLAGIAAADAIVGVFQSEPLSVQGVIQLLNWLNKHSQSGIVTGRFLGMVNNMYEGRRLLTGEVNAEVEKILAERGYRLFDARIPRLVRIAEATVAGKPVTVISPESPGAVALRGLGRQILELMTTEAVLQ